MKLFDSIRINLYRDPAIVRRIAKTTCNRLDAFTHVFRHLSIDNIRIGVHPRFLHPLFHRGVRSYRALRMVWREVTAFCFSREGKRKSHRDTRGDDGVGDSACAYVSSCMCEKAKGENADRDGMGGKSVTVIFGIWVTHKPQLVPWRHGIVVVATGTPGQSPSVQR